MNNQVYLKKIMREERMNAKVDMLRDHIQLVKQESKQHHINESIKQISKKYLLEQTAHHSDTSWSNPKINQQKAAELLVKAGAEEKEFGVNPVGYELVVDIGDGKKDQFLFFVDHAYSYNLMRNFGWEYKDNKIYLVNVSDNTLIKLADKKYVATIDEKGNFDNLSVGEEDEPTESQGAFGISGETLDKIQTAMDWAGLVPYIGDAIDAINAMLYFYRGKYFDGFLSSLAIIPVIGSVLKLGIKGVIKGSRLAKLSKLIKGAWLAKSLKRENILRALYKNLIDTKAIDPTQLKTIMKGLGGIESTLRKSRRGISKIPFFGKSKSTLDAIENMENFIKANKIAAGNADEVIKNMNKISKTDLAKTANQTDPLVTGVKDIAKNTRRVGLTKKAMNIMTFGILPRLKKYSFYPAKTLEAIDKASSMRFVRKAAGTPEKAGNLWHLSKGLDIAGLEKNLNKQFSDFAKANPQSATDLKNLFNSKNPGLVGRRNKLNLSKLNNKEMTELLQTMQKTSPELTQDFMQSIAKHNMDQGGFMWNMYKNDELVKLRSSQTFNALRTRLAKHYDVIWNEAQDFAEDLGWSRDDPNGVIYPLTKAMMANAMPGVYKDMKDTVIDAGQTAKAVAEPIKALLKIGGSSMGIDVEQFEDYEVPEGEYTYEE